MAIKRKKYHPLSKEAVEIYKKRTKDLEKNRSKLTNASLIAMKRRLVSVIHNNKSLEIKIKHLNKYLKHKKQEDVTKVLRYWLSDLHK